MADHYVLICDRADCRPLFRASEAPAYGTCGRAMTISPFPEWAKETIVELIGASTLQPEHPLVTSVALMQRHPVPSTEQELRESLDRWSEPQVSQHAEGPDEVRAWYVRRSAADARHISVRVVQHVLLGSSLFVALIGTLVWLALGLARREWSAGRGMLGRALAVRLGFFGLGVGLILVFPIVPPPLLLLAPVSLLFALLDLATYSVAWLRRKQARLDDSCPTRR